MHSRRPDQDREDAHRRRAHHRRMRSRPGRRTRRCGSSHCGRRFVRAGRDQTCCVWSNGAGERCAVPQMTFRAGRPVGGGRGAFGAGSVRDRYVAGPLSGRRYETSGCRLVAARDHALTARLRAVSGGRLAGHDLWPGGYWRRPCRRHRHIRRLEDHPDPSPDLDEVDIRSVDVRPVVGDPPSTRAPRTRSIPRITLGSTVDFRTRTVRETQVS